MEGWPVHGCLPLQPPKLGFPAVTDCKCGLNLRAISMFCTGLLTVFLNSEVTGLAGLTSYLLMWKSFGSKINFLVLVQFQVNALCMNL